MDMFVSDGDYTQIKEEVPEPIYPEEQEVGDRPAPRVDIEQINLVTDDEDDLPEVSAIGRNKGKGKMSTGKGGMRPVRLHRKEHKERVAIVNTDSAAEAIDDSTEKPTEAPGAENMFLPEETGQPQTGFLREGKKWMGAWRDEFEANNTPQVKHDPDVPPDTMDIDSDPDAIANTTDAPATAQPLPGSDPDSPSLERKQKAKILRPVPKEKPPVLQTEEDKAEYMRHLEDVHILAQELGGLQRPSTTTDGDGVIDVDVDMDDDAPRMKDKEGRLYLFQFPPILPPLRNVVKKEELADGGEGDMMHVDGATGGAGAVDLTVPENELDAAIKAETIEDASHINTTSDSHGVQQLVTEEGSIGTLVVRKSGKVELNWGGTILKLGRGAESEFLTTTMIIDEMMPEGQEEAAQGEGMAGMGGTFGKKKELPVGVGSAMGRVMGKFVATPDWGVMMEMD
jgi:DNA-directed RNA polymerase III subunit RPC4